MTNIISSSMIEIAESRGRMDLWQLFKDQGAGLFLHELKIQKELCETILKCNAKNEIDKIAITYAEGIKKICDNAIAMGNGITDPVEEILETWRKEK